MSENLSPDLSQYKGILVIHLVDAVTYGPPGLASGVRVEVEGVLKKPLRKPNGMWVFTEVPPGSRRVTVKGGSYHGQTFTVTPEALDPKYPVVIAPLSPLPSYPFPDGTTLIRASVQEPGGRRLSGVPVRARVVTAACARARLAKEAGEGAQELSLARVAGRLQAGERLWLPGESLVISDVGDDNRSLRLQQPLANAYKKQALLLPCAETASDERGEVVLWFGNCRSASFDVEIEVLQGTSERKEVRVEEGRTTQVGFIVIEP
ncbi:hypothetical protein [Tumebacillus flagellatus]|uniref:Uncharacterized protein n=1 Tax=Tumebacillus flagellatus TaxID=1157490 RepID=A0A074LPZ3_9BACL|nr:hypothetical protein [Tumebacillus flagellatus]KEO82555.1 hypothetical protein EL26_15080 [Tumebacillus flagellatus]